MAEEELKAILREAFGDSSSDSDGESPRDRRRGIQVNNSSDEIARPLSVFGDSHTWEPIAEINGLWICRDFLSADQQSSLLSALEKEGYLAEASHNQVSNYKALRSIALRYICILFCELHKNRVMLFSFELISMSFKTIFECQATDCIPDSPKAMRFGDLPPWALELSYIIRENILFSSYFSESMELENSKEKCLFPSELLWREPFFNQLIVNIYQPGEGIAAHVDLMRFEDGIAIVSLESSCVMHFSSVQAEAEVNDLEEVNKDSTPSPKIPVLLTPGSVVLMWGEARYLWKHEINRKPGFQMWEGKEINQKRRISVTLRRLCQTEQNHCR